MEEPNDPLISPCVSPLPPRGKVSSQRLPGWEGSRQPFLPIALCFSGTLIWNRMKGTHVVLKFPHKHRFRGRAQVTTKKSRIPEKPGWCLDRAISAGFTLALSSVF